MNDLGVLLNQVADEAERLSASGDKSGKSLRRLVNHAKDACCEGYRILKEHEPTYFAVKDAVSLSERLKETRHHARRRSSGIGDEHVQAAVKKLAKKITELRRLAGGGR